ncbi:MAG: hypothetical protein CMC79_01805 [Flavobacteriaceae bacterium]|nr:hypothetical protein [Flavobacteriaceae bacterium]|tara:strand:+ start:8862 stop:9359 length:498 start_codon:yes stop_codon:yes gene_type:complete
MELVFSAVIIFILRLADQSLGTIRALLVSKKPFYAALIGLVESAIWIIAVSKVVRDIDHPILIFGYAVGFALGTIAGSYLENIIGIGSIVIRVFSPSDSPSIAGALREKGYLVTVIDGEGRDGGVRVCWSIVPRRKRKAVIKIIKDINPNAYVTMDLANPISLKK